MSNEPRKGNYYMHPEVGLIKVTGGYYLDPIYGRVSNHFHWVEIPSGHPGSGYAMDTWEPVVVDSHVTRLVLPDGSEVVTSV